MQISSYGYAFKFVNSIIQIVESRILSVYHLTLKSHFISDFLHQNAKMSPFETTTFLWT